MVISQEKKEMFDYLNRVRLLGVTNMFGAAPYLALKFGLNSRESRAVLRDWMNHFNEDGYEHLLTD